MTAIELTVPLAPMAGALWRIMLFGLLFGAGLPALFALGLRLLSPAVAAASPGDAGVVCLTHPSTLRRVAAWGCFAVTGAAVCLGIVLLVLGGR